MSYRRVYIVLGSIVLIALIACGIYIGVKIHQAQVSYQSTETIILSPHYDDAVLSLGGLMAQHTYPIVVATFFTARPATATSTSWDAKSGFNAESPVQATRLAENTAALKVFGATAKDYGYYDNQYGHGESDQNLEADLTKDIQALIASYSGKNINVYGPAYFNANITHPDHALLHKAFLDVAKNYPNQNVHFYIYEDFPYTDLFNKESVISLKKNLENESGLFLTQQSILLTSHDVDQKLLSLKAYASQLKAFTGEGDDIISHTKKFTSTRCGTDPQQACEVVYALSTF